jgi:hypothetical protein
MTAIPSDDPDADLRHWRALLGELRIRKAEGCRTPAA